VQIKELGETLDACSAPTPGNGIRAATPLRVRHQPTTDAGSFQSPSCQEQRHFIDAVLLRTMIGFLVEISAEMPSPAGLVFKTPAVDASAAG
jgi:hypothetical protein